MTKDHTLSVPPSGKPESGSDPDFSACGDLSEKRFPVCCLPESWRPYALLMRLDRPIGIWLLFLPASWAIVLAAGGFRALNGHDLGVLALFALGSVIMRGAGCVINDMWDRDIDAQTRRTCQRPLAAGVVSLRAAMVFLAGLLVCGLAILLHLPFVSVFLGILVLPLIAVYPLMKRITWWPQLFLGVTFNFGALMGWAAVTGVVGLPALCLYGAGILWTLAYDTIYAHQDCADDLQSGVKSTALRLGGRSKIWVSGFQTGAWVLIAMALWMTDAPWAAFAALVLPAGYAVRSLLAWTPYCPQSSLRTFRASRNFGLLVLFAIGLTG